jgi:hypothetical protein
MTNGSSIIHPQYKITVQHLKPRIVPVVVVVLYENLHVKYFFILWQFRVIIDGVSICNWIYWPVTVAARSKARTVFASSDAGILGSNPLKAWMSGVCMRLFCVCVVLCLGSSLATSWSLVQGVLPTVKMITELNERPGPWLGWKSH